MKNAYRKRNKILCIILLFSMLTSILSGCSPSEEEKVAEVERLLNAISIDDLAIDSVITQAENAYNNLDEHLKQQVSNYYKLEEGRAISEVRSLMKTTEALAENRTISSLKNPSSCKKIGSSSALFYDAALKNPICCIISINFSANNSFGGRVDGSSPEYYYKYEKDGETWCPIEITAFEYYEKREGSIQVDITGSDLYEKRKALSGGADE